MKRFLFPLLLIAAGAFGLAEHDAINQQWADMYPDDPARQAALAHCAAENALFNRFSSEARAACYQKFLQVTEMPVIAIPGAVAPAQPALRSPAGAHRPHGR